MGYTRIVSEFYGIHTEVTLFVPIGGSQELRDICVTNLRDQLVEIETAAFATDRLSRRAFRARMASQAAALIVAEAAGRIVGYTLVEFRRTTLRARLFSLARTQDAPHG